MILPLLLFLMFLQVFGLLALMTLTLILVGRATLALVLSGTGGFVNWAGLLLGHLQVLAQGGQACLSEALYIAIGVVLGGALIKRDVAAMGHDLLAHEALVKVSSAEGLQTVDHLLMAGIELLGELNVLLRGELSDFVVERLVPLDQVLAKLFDFLALAFLLGELAELDLSQVVLIGVLNEFLRILRDFLEFGTSCLRHGFTGLAGRGLCGVQ